MEHDTMMQQCIDNCTSCETICMQTIGHSLRKGGAHAKPEHISLLRDCALICSTSREFMIRNSAWHKKVCGVCALICDACAADCERFKDDDQLAACADACTTCAASCREMSSQ